MHCWCIPLLEWAEVREGWQVERIKDFQSDKKANLCLWECGSKEKWDIKQSWVRGTRTVTGSAEPVKERDSTAGESKVAMRGTEMRHSSEMGITPV